MPILAIDKFGQFYESDPDRHDGKGYKGKVPTSGHGDVTLGAAYLKAETDRINQELKAKSMQATMDARDVEHSRVQKQHQVRAIRNKQAAMAASQNQNTKDFLTLKGVVQTLREESPTQIGLSGDGMSSDGTGYTPRAENRMVSKIEQEQHKLTQKVMGSLGDSGYHLNATGNPTLRGPESQMGSMGLPLYLPKAPLYVPHNPVTHPMAIFFRK